jgi:hypothetical protein
MPNWCKCELTVSGDPEIVREFVQKARTDNGAFDFGAFVPIPEPLRGISSGFMVIGDKEYDYWRGDYDNEVGIEPEEVQKLVATYGAACALDFARKFWGTKWNACDVYCEYEDGSDTAFYEFETAWSPPLPVIRKASEQFPDLDFYIEFWELEGGFRGEAEYRAGEETLLYFNDD